MMVFSTSVTSSPNGSFEVTAGGAAAGGACAAAGERTAKLTAAAATADNHQIREGIIAFSLASPDRQSQQKTRRLQARYYTVQYYIMQRPAGDLFVATL
jgi:hypothetical protein